MSKPLIGLSGSHIFDDHGTFALYPRAYVNHDYVQSILSAGGLPIILPFNEDTSVIQEMISHIDGLVLSGGHDVSPLLYGEEPLQGIGDVWPARDQFDFALLTAATAKKIPIMAICRGHQVVNVFRGGSLFQDLRYDKNCTVKHSQGQTPALPTHTVIIEPNSRFAHIIGKTEMLTNSHHHQTVNRIGSGLQITARAKDGTIEAMEATDYPYLATYQFHPEMMASTSPEAAKLFADFVNATK